MTANLGDLARNLTILLVIFYEHEFLFARIAQSPSFSALLTTLVTHKSTVI